MSDARTALLSRARERGIVLLSLQQLGKAMVEVVEPDLVAPRAERRSRKGLANDRAALTLRADVAIVVPPAALAAARPKVDHLADAEAHTGLVLEVPNRPGRVVDERGLMLGRVVRTAQNANTIERLRASRRSRRSHGGGSSARRASRRPVPSYRRFCGFFRAPRSSDGRVKRPLPRARSCPSRPDQSNV